MSGNIPLKQQKIVCIKSGNRCTLPDCRRELIVEATDKDDPSIVAVFAHIKGEKEGSARYDASMDDTERNKHDNLILICPNCHKKIDDQPETFTAEKLYEMKNAHEAWVLERTKEEALQITFAELEVVTKYLISSTIQPTESLELIPPKDKIKKNNLSDDVADLILIGAIQSNQVSDYIDKSLDEEFGERLKQGFVTQYEQYKENGLEGDELFGALFDFASGGSNNFRQRSAGLAVLVYLFEKCEVFEK